MKKIATKIRDLNDFNGEASLYRLNPPVPHGEFVVASAIAYPLETYIFPATGDGAIASWTEIAGVRGDFSHHGALAELGYEVES